MKPLLIRNIKNQILPILKANNITFAGIFGSFLRGDAHQRSDIDLLVRFSSPKSLLDFIGLERKLSQKLNRRFDLVTEEFLSPYIKQDILKELKVIYEKG